MKKGFLSSSVCLAPHKAKDSQGVDLFSNSIQFFITTIAKPNCRFAKHGDIYWQGVVTVSGHWISKCTHSTLLPTAKMYRVLDENYY